MAYEVTATRRRPQAFDSLAGQEFVAQTLKNTIEAKRIAHAYLFSGPRGCGKTSTARIFAKALNCENGPTVTPCGKCSHCLEITQGASPDVIEIDGASNTSVNDVRQIKEEVLFAPQGSKYKIYIIDEVHMLSTSAFNALLKTIEEPPEYVIFIFATTELHKVPATIKSRCQQFNFRLVPIETVEKLLEEAANEIGIKADEEALYWVARESTGSVRDAYTLFDQVAAFSGDHITYEKIRDKLGLVGVDLLNVIFEDCVEKRSGDAVLKLDEFLQKGISIEQFISNSTDYLRSLLLIKNGITKESLLGQSQERFSVNVLNAWNPIQIERAISIFLQLYRDIRYSLSPRYELELAISRLSWLREYVSPMEVKFAIDQTKNLLLSTQTSAQVLINQGQQNGAGQNFSRLMNPTSWQQNPVARQQNINAQPLQPKNPLPVLDALKNLPEYQNATSVTENKEQRESVNQIPQNQTVENQNVVQNPQSVQMNVQRLQPNSQPESEVPLKAQGFENVKPAADFDSIEEKNLKNFIASELRVNDGILAASILGTKNWKKGQNRVTFEVENDFQKMNFDKNKQLVLNSFARIFGRQIDFDVVLKKIEYVDPKKNAPETVRLLLSTFRGEIIGVMDKSEAMKNPLEQSQEFSTEIQHNDTDDETDESENQISYDEDSDDDE